MRHFLCFITVLYLSATSEQFELGRLYHYSYQSDVEARSFGIRAFPRDVSLSGHVDVCAVWSSGEDELLLVEFHKLTRSKSPLSTDHSHSASSGSPDFAVAHIHGDSVLGVFFPTSTNTTVASLLNGFAGLLVRRSDEMHFDGRLFVRNAFDSSFGSHHPISIDASQLLTLPALDDAGEGFSVEPISLSTSVQSHLISTSECSHALVDGKDASSALNTIASRTSSTFTKFQSEFSRTKETETADCLAISQNPSFAEAISHVDCVTTTSTLELHKSFFANFASLSHMSAGLLRRYFGNMCLKRREVRDKETVIYAITESLKLAEKSVADKNAEQKQELGYGLTCLLNHICSFGQSAVCQQMSALVFDHILSSYQSCSEAMTPVSCQLSIIRSLDSVAANFPRSHSFLFELATQKGQHPQIASGSLRALGRPGVTWVPRHDEFLQILELFEKSVFEVRFAAMDLLLSPSSFLLKGVDYAAEFAKSANRILSGDAAEISPYLASRLRFLIANNNLFRATLILADGRFIFSLANSASTKPLPTSVYIAGPLFPYTPLTYWLDVQNGMPDTLAHSSFSVNVRNWKLFEVEIDAVGVDTLMGGLVGGSGDAEAKTDIDQSGVIEPAASFTVKLSGSSNTGSVVARHADLFRGQNDLMGAVWNAPSELIDIAKVNSTIINVNLDDISLINGLSVEASVSFVVNVAVRAAASISLWSQSAETLISTNVGVSAKTSLSIPVLEMSRLLNINGAADLSFRTNIGLGSSGRPDVCLRMSCDKAHIVASLSKWKKSKKDFVKRSSFAPVNYAFHIYNSQSCAKQLQNW